MLILPFGLAEKPWSSEQREISDPLFIYTEDLACEQKIKHLYFCYKYKKPPLFHSDDLNTHYLYFLQSPSNNIKSLHLFASPVELPFSNLCL